MKSLLVTINQYVKDYVPSSKYGIIHYEDITISHSPQMLKGRIRLFQESLLLDLEDKDMKDIIGIREWRSIFKKTGTDPSRYRPSVEALYRRIKKGDFLNPFNSAVDLNNFFSLKYEIPLGIYDASHVREDIDFRIGGDHDTFEGLNGREISLKNMLHTADHIGPFGSPFVDSKRTAVSESTKDAIHIIYFKPSMDINECKEMLNAISEMFIQVHGGTSNHKVVF
ncbi:B3/B4 domain-containing protein [Sutcliffiella halmapala]|uniref:B3/B4 domain-containing protein n=1 Tax=Sutcliffiella halmapala TaxID=79882 RepID=UPI001116C584|nr:phenylalanine--tRNA ligase beta subunit-related protein [Sutcliffiella halmapala]